MISDTLKIDKAWKFVQGIGLSSPEKEFYEEDSSDSGFTLHGNDIYVNDIPETPPGVSSAIVEVVTDFVLINDISVPGNLSWYASTDGSTLEQMRATRQGDWIPSRFGQGYTVILKDNTGQQIFTTDSIDWVFDYKTGILICESDPDVSYSLPLKISAYRYIGERLTGGTADWIAIEDVGDYFTADNVEDALQNLGAARDAISTGLSDHLADTEDSHDASTISVLDSGENYTGDNVEDVLTEIADSIGAISLEAANVTVVDAGGYFTGDNVETVLAEIAVEVDANTSGLGTLTTDINDHLVDADDAHDASAISVEDVDERFDSDNIEGTLSELWNSVDLNTASLLAHIYTSDESHLASVILITDTLENFTSNHVEGALIELINAIDTNTGNIANNTSEILQSSTDINDHLVDADDAHDASAISVLDSGENYTGDNVEDVLTEIADNIGAISLEAANVTVDDVAGYYTGMEVETVLAEIGLALSGISVAAEDITVVDAGEYFVADNVEAVLQELADRVDGNIADILNNAADINVLDSSVDVNANDILSNAANMTNHLADTVDSHDASSISVLDSGGYYTGDNVETVFAEVAVSIADHLADTVDSHDASAISVLDTGDYLDAIQVESVLQELIVGVNDNDAKLLEHEVRITDLETDNINTNEYTPTGTADSAGNEGDITYDDDYIYVKTSAGWKSAGLTAF